MSDPHRPADAPGRARLGAFVAGMILLGTVGSCELPGPQIPSIGVTPAQAPGAAVGTVGGPRLDEARQIAGRTIGAGA